MPATTVDLPSAARRASKGAAKKAEGGVKKAAIVIQAHTRGFLGRMRFDVKRKVHLAAAIVIQAHIRRKRLRARALPQDVLSERPGMKLFVQSVQAKASKVNTEVAIDMPSDFAHAVRVVKAATWATSATPATAPVPPTPQLQVPRASGGGIETPEELWLNTHVTAIEKAEQSEQWGKLSD